MTTISVKSIYGEVDTVKGFLINGLDEEKKKIEYALEKSVEIINKYEKQYGISTSSFLEKVKKGEMEENEETFQWWAETKLADELREKLKTISEIEICQS